MGILEVDCRKTSLKKKTTKKHFSKLISEFGMQVWTFTIPENSINQSKSETHTHDIGSGCMRGSATEKWISGGLSELCGLNCSAQTSKKSIWSNSS